MKHTLWLAFLLPITAFAHHPSHEDYTEAQCIADPTDPICVGFVIDRAEIDSNDNELADHEARITDLENVPEGPFVARLGAADSVGTLFNSFIVTSNGTGNIVSDFIVYLEQTDGTLAAVVISDSHGGHWSTGNIRYSGTGCTGTAYYIAAWTFSALSDDEGSIVINASVGFDGIPYTFSIGPLFSATVASNVVSGHPVSAPVCNNFSPFVQTGVRFAIPVQGLPAIVLPPSVATVQLSP